MANMIEKIANNNKKKKKKKKKSLCLSEVILRNANRIRKIAKEEEEETTRLKTTTTTTTREEDENAAAWETYKQNVVSGIREMIEQDVDRAKQSAAEYASEVCGSDSVIAVLGVRDGFVESFLKAVVKKRRVKVIF